MKIQYHKRFEKRFKKLPPKIQKNVILAIQKFIIHPHDPQLRNHALSGNLQGLRAFSVMSDIRIIFEERDQYTIVIMLDVGTHNQVYKN